VPDRVFQLALPFSWSIFIDHSPIIS
jgi:hypothetical protein